MSKRLSDEIAGWVSEALAADPSARREDFTYDVGLQIIQQDQGPAPVVVLYLSLPAATLGNVHVTCNLMPAGAVNQAQVAAGVAQTVQQLLNQRSAELAQIGTNPLIGKGLLRKAG